MYAVFAASPVLEYVVETDPVFATMIVQVELPLTDLSISYPVIVEPPLPAAVQDKLICDDETALAVNPVGGSGIVATASVVAEAVFDAELVPSALIANTL